MPHPPHATVALAGARPGRRPSGGAALLALSLAFSLSAAVALHAGPALAKRKPAATAKAKPQDARPKEGEQMAHPSPERPTQVQSGPKVREILGQIARVLVNDRTIAADGRFVNHTYVLTDKAEIDRVLGALGTEQRLGPSCETCAPLVTMTFEAKLGLERGDLGLFCKSALLDNQARFRSGGSQDCRTLTVADVPALRQLIAGHRTGDKATQAR